MPGGPHGPPGFFWCAGFRNLGRTMNWNLRPFSTHWYSPGTSGTHCGERKTGVIDLKWTELPDDATRPQRVHRNSVPGPRIPDALGQTPPSRCVASPPRRGRCAGRNSRPSLSTRQRGRAHTEVLRLTVRVPFSPQLPFGPKPVLPRRPVGFAPRFPIGIRQRLDRLSGRRRVGCYCGARPAAQHVRLQSEMSHRVQTHTI
jgi:hypothetical protein